MNGTLFSYYGDEVGLYGTNKGNNNVDQNVRIPIKWGDFSNLDCSVINGVTSMAYPYPTVKEQLEDTNSILNYYKKVLLLRNQNPEILHLYNGSHAVGPLDIACLYQTLKTP